jgi:hypothetical protein
MSPVDIVLPVRLDGYAWVHIVVSTGKEYY